MGSSAGSDARVSWDQRTTARPGGTSSYPCTHPCGNVCPCPSCPRAGGRVFGSCPACSALLCLYCMKRSGTTVCRGWGRLPGQRSPPQSCHTPSLLATWEGSQTPVKGSQRDLTLPVTWACRLVQSPNQSIPGRRTAVNEITALLRGNTHTWSAFMCCKSTISQRPTESISNSPRKDDPELCLGIAEKVLHSAQTVNGNIRTAPPPESAPDTYTFGEVIPR